MIKLVFSDLCKIGRFIAIVACLISLAACTVGGVNDGNRPTTSQTPNAERIGSGTVTVGLLVGDDYGALSDGATNAPYLAGKLATQKLTKTPITLVVRRAGNDGSSLRNSAASLRSANVDIVITDVDAAQSAQLAAELSGNLIPVITLASTANVDRMLYSADTDTAGEARILVEKARALKLKNIFVVRTPASRSSELTAQIESQAAKNGLQVAVVNIGSSEAINLQQTGAGAQAALMFATSPKLASAFLAGQTNPANGQTVFGNADWALDLTAYANLSGAYLPVPTENKLPNFAQLFKSTFGQNASIRSAAIYDLVVLTAALPQIAGAEAYTPRILTNDKGFKGQLGWFRLNEQGRSIRKWILVQRQ